MHSSHTYSFNGQPVAYKKTGAGKPLLVLHGWGSSSDVMLPLAQSLANIRTCYIPDLPGFGDSPQPPRPWSLEDYTGLVEQFIREVIGGKTDLLVHSFGARIAIKLLSSTAGSELAARVLVTGGAGMKPRRSLTFYLKSYTARLLKLPFTLLPASLRDRALGRLRNSALWKALGSSDYNKLEGVMRETFVQTVSEHLDEHLEQIPHEVLLLWGKEDNATPLYQAERMEKGIGNAALVAMDRAGHYAFLDRPEKFTAIARAFYEH